MGLLDELKKEAEAKQHQQEAEQQRHAELEARSREEVLPKLAHIYGFLADLLKTVDVLQPDTRATYTISGYGPLDDLLQHDYQLKADSRENMTHVSLYFECIGKDKFSFSVDDPAQIDRQKDYFDQNLLSYYTREYRDNRHAVTHAKFTVESKIPIAFDFRLMDNLTTIKLTVRNFEVLGKREYTLEPEQIDTTFLDELAKYLLRHESDFLKLDISDDFRNSIRQRLAEETAAQKKKFRIRRQNDSNITYLDQQHQQGQPANEASDNWLEEALQPEADWHVEQDQQPQPEQETPAEQIKAEQKPEPAIEQHKPVAHKPLTTLPKFSNLPTPIKEAAKQDLDKKVYIERLKQLHNFPDRLFQNASQSLSTLNRAIIKPSRRLELLSAIIGQVYPVIASTFQKYQQQEHSLPENHTRREVLLACIGLVEQIGICYKHLFLDSINNEKNPSQVDIFLNGFRILEMARLEQRLRALRYQKMSSSTWRDTNAIFFYLNEHLNIEQPQDLIGTAGMWVQHRAIKGNQGATCNIKMLYLSIQLFGMLDTTSWPLWLLHVPDTYLAWLDDALKILPDQGQKLVPGYLIAAANHDKPAAFERKDEAEHASILIDYAVLFNFLVKEHEDLSKMHLVSRIDEEKLSKPLRGIQDHDRIPMLETILLSLHNRQRQQQRHAAFGTEELQVYFGFDDTWQLLDSQNEGSGMGLQPKSELTESLAGKSSLLQDDTQGVMPSWQMINFSTGGLLLGTEETDFLSPIEVGQIVSFKTSNSKQAPILGYVCRVQRNSYKNVEIAITRLSNKMEAVMAIKAEGIKQTGLPSLLFKDKDDQWRLLVKNKYGFINGNPLQVIRTSGERIPARLGTIWLVKNRFTVYGVSSPHLA